VSIENISIPNLRVAILHDWLFHMRGGEKCLRDLCELFPNSEIFTLFHSPNAELAEEIRSKKLHASILNPLKRFYKYLLPIFPIGCRDLSRRLRVRHRAEPFDLVLSVSHCAVKNVKVPNGLPHLCYCLTPARYLWDQFDRYVEHPMLRRIGNYLREYLQTWDREGASGVTNFIAISNFVRERIQRVYQVDSEVVYPGVELDPKLPTSVGKGAEFLVVNALVPYKNTAVTIRAFNELGLPLRVVGRGSELAGLKAIASSNIEFEERVSEERLWHLYRNCAALIFAAEEDFGMTPVEAESSGRPVICYSKGGALETILPGKTGVYFSDLTPDAVADAVRQFLAKKSQFKFEAARAQAEQFSRSSFSTNFVKTLTKLGYIEEAPVRRSTNA